MKHSLNLIINNCAHEWKNLGYYPISNYVIRQAVLMGLKKTTKKHVFSPIILRTDYKRNSSMACALERF